MIRILNIIGSVGYGGAETLLMNIYRALDRKRFQLDFLVCEKPGEESYQHEIERLGGKIYIVPSKSEGLFQNMSAIYKIVQEQQYKIVWRHTHNMFKSLDLLAAKLAGAQHTILHSHNTGGSGAEEILGRLCRPFSRFYITDRFACGEEAGRHLFGKQEFRMIHNGVDSERFSYHQETRNDYRERFGFLENNLVIGHVGRFVKEKNHTFLLDVFRAVLEKNPDARLVLAGTGNLQPDMKKKAEQLQISDKVYFLGARTDIAELMQMMDVFLMPSLWEGLPLVLIEAQAADIPCLAADSIDRSVKILPDFSFCSLTESPEVWADRLLAIQRSDRRSRRQEIAAAGYDIETTAAKLEQIFEKMYCS